MLSWEVTGAPSSHLEHAVIRSDKWILHIKRQGAIDALYLRSSAKGLYLAQVGSQITHQQT